jgi:hypothetical protein
MCQYYIALLHYCIIALLHYCIIAMFCMDTPIKKRFYASLISGAT